MTRSEAKALLDKIKKEGPSTYADMFINFAEALGIIKFEEMKTIFHIHQFENWGDIKIEKWPEGLLLWVGGVVQWKSWKKENE